MSITVPPPYPLLEAIRANDEKAMQQFYTANYGTVEKFVLKNSGTADDARDIYQEAFITLWRNVQLDRFKPMGDSSLNGYLFQIARNKWIDHLRATKHRKATMLDKERENMMTFEESDDIIIKRLKKIKEKFKELGDNCRELLGRFYYKKQSLKDIAAGFQWTEATVKNNKYRCMEKLRAMMANKTEKK